MKHIVTFAAVALIVAASGGIGFVQHYCSCEDDARMVVASPSHDMEAGTCCSEEPVAASDACCSSKTEDAGDDEGHACHSGHGCCSEQYTFFKTDQFNVVGSQADASKIYSLKVNEISTTEPPVITAIQTSSLISDRSPPDLFGRSLLIQIHQLKTDPLMS